MKTFSYRRRAVGGIGVGLTSCGAKAEVRGCLGGWTGRPLESELRDVVLLMMDEWSEDDAVVDASELRFDDGVTRRGGGGGGVGLDCGRTA